MVLMFLPDMVKLLDRLGVRRSKDGIPAQEERVQGGVGGSACAVHEAPSSSLVLPPGCFVVPSKKSAMYGKNMRDVDIGRFSMQSDWVVRFRASDDKVAVGDILVGVGHYDKFEDAQDIILKMLLRDDNKVNDLLSLEVDKNLEDEVGHVISIKNLNIIFVPGGLWDLVLNFPTGTKSNLKKIKQGKSIVLMFFPDVLKFFNRFGVRPDNVAIIPQAERAQGGVGGSACAEQGLSSGCFTVTCKNASMYGKKLRDVHIAGFSVQSDAVVRFRSSDGKVAVADLLVGVGKYGRFSEAQRMMSTLIDINDNKINDLGSLELDMNLTDEVIFNFNLYWYKITFKNYLYLVQGCTPYKISTTKCNGTKSNLTKFKKGKSIVTRAQSKVCTISNYFEYLYQYSI